MKIISLNIEGNFHLPDRVIPFLKNEAADIICLQEVFRSDLTRLAAILTMTVKFVPMAMITPGSKDLTAGEIGIAQLVNPSWSITNWSSEYYFSSVSQPLPKFIRYQGDPNVLWRALLWVELTKNEQTYVIATTHFTWSPEGNLTNDQIRDWLNLEKILKRFPRLILNGDFNSPRQGGPDNIYHRLARLYQDQIPPQIITTVDPQLHRIKSLNLVVDGLFTTPDYQINNVHLVSGVSDHQAVVAEVFPSPVPPGGIARLDRHNPETDQN